MVNKIKTKDLTKKSVGALETPSGVNVINSNPTVDLKAQLKDIKTQRKNLNTQIKGLDKQEKDIKKQINKSKKQ